MITKEECKERGGNWAAGSCYLTSDGTKSLSNTPILLKDVGGLKIKTICWQGRVNINCSLDSPYLMDFMLNLNKDEAKQFVKQIEASIEDINKKVRVLLK